MTWWLIPLILGVIAAGSLAGLTLSKVWLGRRDLGLHVSGIESKVEIQNQVGTVFTPKSLQEAATIVEKKLKQETVKISQPKTSEKIPATVAAKTSPDISETNRAGSPEESPVVDMFVLPRQSELKNQVFNNTSNVDEEPPAPLKEEQSPAAEVSKNAAMAEVEYNFTLAEKPLNGTLSVFKTIEWDNKRDEFDAMDPEIKWQITQAYTEMFLANNIARVFRELGGDDEHMTSSYLELKSKVGERLRHVLESLGTASK